MIEIKSPFSRCAFCICFLLWFLPCASLAQISPGPLAMAHAKLEGITKCLACHEVGQQTSNVKCLNCHVAIAERLQRRRGVHAFIMAKEEKLCASCHSEHNGEDFALIFWENGEANFDHQQAGYVLEGKHKALACRNCHQSKFIQEKVVNDQSVRAINTFLGLSQKCVTCHADEHRAQLGTTCERCHDFFGWKPAAKFSHNQAKFLLTGRHQQVACAKCHLEKPVAQKVGKELTAAYVQYTGLQFANCRPCHQDPHRGGFGADCAKCHTTESWKSIATGAFNHELTGFPLRGRHRNLQCEKCHGRGDFKTKLAHQFCRDCHADAHASQFAQRVDKGNCKSCHTVEG